VEADLSIKVFERPFVHHRRRVGDFDGMLQLVAEQRQALATHQTRIDPDAQVAHAAS
jgi:hypothetical protein